MSLDPRRGYDLIGDIHGCAQTLERLLERLGYSRQGGVWCHPTRMVIFLGDLVDRGPGIPEAVASQIGRPFFTTSEYGTGLGLYIARELAKANGATLDYVSVPGGGACFRLVLSGRNPLLSA